MPPLTLEKALLIAIIIGLGATIIANVPAKSNSGFNEPTLRVLSSTTPNAFWERPQ